MHDSESYERINVYSTEPTGDAALEEFKRDFDNTGFRRSRLTWGMLFLILIFYPVISVGFTDDPTEMLRNLDESMLMILLVSTILMQWFFFLLVFGTVYRENTGLAGLGLTPLRRTGWMWLLYFGWAMAFLLGANLILAGLAWFLAQIGLPMPGEIGLLIPTDPTGRVVWVLVSFTAGYCEEVLFRGYLMTRLRLVFNMKSWVLPVILSGLAFGACHAYQGWPGFIVLTVYGIMFAVLYVRTKSLWPCVIAHFFQDFSALFFPQ